MRGVVRKRSKNTRMAKSTNMNNNSGNSNSKKKKKKKKTKTRTADMLLLSVDAGLEEMVDSIPHLDCNRRESGAVTRPGVRDLDGRKGACSLV